MKKLCATCQKEFSGDVESCPDDGGKLLVLDSETADPLIGTTVDGRYVVQSTLGVGGMGAVYRAHQKTMNRAIALKVLKRELSNDPQIVKRFLREVQAVSVLRHPNTIIVYDFGQTPENLLYIAMEYLEGTPLADRLKEVGALPVRQSLEIIGQVCGALTEAHGKGIIHRDLKPDNIFLANMGGTDVVKVLDFGIAKLDNSDQQTQLTRAGLTVGTPPYMSPEQAEGRLDITTQSDIYSLGCILFECLTGRPPFIGDSPVKVLMDHCTAEVPALQVANPTVQVPPQVEAIVMAMLQKDATRRPPSASALAEHLQALLSGAAPQPFMGAAAADIGVGDTAAWESAEVRAAADGFDPLAATSAWDSSEISAEGAAAGDPMPHLHTDLAGEAVPASTDAAVASIRRGFPVVPVTTAVVVALGIGGFLAWSNRSGKGANTSAVSAQAAKPAQVKPPPAPKPEEPKARFIWLRSTPAGAKVMDGKDELGKTPLKLEVIPEIVQRLVVKHDGFKSMDIAIDPGMKDDLSVSLVAAPKVVRQPKRPARRPKPRPKPVKKPRPSEEDILVDDLK